jgi:hypothetical protein
VPKALLEKEAHISRQGQSEMALSKGFSRKRPKKNSAGSGIFYVSLLGYLCLLFSIPML